MTFVHAMAVIAAAEALLISKWQSRLLSGLLTALGF
jgi:hypothetical protein